jgi:hypothetical protein
MQTNVQVETRIRMPQVMNRKEQICAPMALRNALMGDSHSISLVDPTYHDHGFYWTISPQFCNDALLQNIRESPTSMKMHCNADSRTTKLVGDLPGYGTVWYDPKGIANILIKAC